MKQRIMVLLCSISMSLAAFTPIPTGTPLWCIQQQTGQTVDLIESKVEEIITTAGTAGGCAFTEIGQANIIGGILSLTASGNYCLTQDIIADVVITGTSIYFDLNGHQIGTDGTRGRISIDGLSNTVTNGSIFSVRENPFLAAAIIILSTASNTTISKLLITTLDSTDIVAAHGIDSLGKNSTINNCIIKTGNGKNAIITGNTAGNGINSIGENAIIEQCYITTGNGGGFNTDLNGLNGGVGILINDKNTLIKDCFINTGNGGPGVTQLSPTLKIGRSGNGGIGILVQRNAIDTRIINTTIEKTGKGGPTDIFNEEGFSTSAAGGSGGNGIQINTGALRTLVYQCSINNTGQPTSSINGTGVGGKAILDSVLTDTVVTFTDSKIFKNIAANIANPIKFDLGGSGVEKGIMSPNPPTATSLNPWANIYL